MIRSSLLPILFIATTALIAMPVIEAKASNSKIMFDDFSYKTLAEAQKMAGYLEHKVVIQA
jgi:hypothetical protein|tara:strand:+ start:742 stop:924 length:183 start_codon:yes stop_codon:yes gene_type:complete